MRTIVAAINMIVVVIIGALVDKYTSLNGSVFIGACGVFLASKALFSQQRGH